MKISPKTTNFSDKHGGLILLFFGKILEHIYDDVGNSSYYRTDRNCQNPSP